jgi:hypothetical protein
MRLGLRMLLVAVACALLPMTVMAHHGWSGQGEQEFEITGTVASAVSLSGPHATMKVKATDGQVWDLTLAPPARTERAGLNEKAIPVGSTVTVHGHRSRDGKRYEIKTERVTFNGKTFNVYPDRQ